MDRAQPSSSKNGPMFKIGEPAPVATLLDESGKKVNLADLWSEKPTLLAFVRHFG